MANVDGVWDTIIKTPFGKRRGKLTIKTDGEAVTGSYFGDLGGSEISEGRLSGSTINCSVDATKPMRMTLQIEATVEGDTLDGRVKTESFGTQGFSGTRA